MTVDKNRFFEGTCKACKNVENCKGREMYSCARMRMFNYKEFEKYTGITREGKTNG